MQLFTKPVIPTFTSKTLTKFNWLELNKSSTSTHRDPLTHAPNVLNGLLDVTKGVVHLGFIGCAEGDGPRAGAEELLDRRLSFNLIG